MLILLFLSASFPFQRLLFDSVGQLPAVAFGDGLELLLDASETSSSLHQLGLSRLEHFPVVESQQRTRQRGGTTSRTNSRTNSRTMVGRNGDTENRLWNRIISE